jgi:hypothetical protein
MSRTKQELIDNLLLDLNVIGLGQTASAEESDFVSANITSALAELNARDVVNVLDEDAIDDAVFQPLNDLLMARLGPSFGRPGADQPTLLLLEDRIKEVTRHSGTRATLGTERMLRQGNRGPYRGFNPVTG